MRRAIAAVALLVVVILIAVGVHSCQVSQRNSALRDYSDGVASIMRSSNQTGQQFFSVLSSGQSASNGTNLQSQIDEARLSAENQLNRAAATERPRRGQGRAYGRAAELADAQGRDCERRRNRSSRRCSPPRPTAAVNSIAAEMARLYSSDVVYKDYALPAIVWPSTARGSRSGRRTGFRS